VGGIPGGINTFLRYTYAGFLVAWPILDIWWWEINCFLDSYKIGEAVLVTLGLFSFLVLGTLFHAIYRVLFGELFLYPVAEDLCQFVFRGRGSVMSRLEGYGISGRFVRRQANRLIRAEVFREKFRRRVDIRQGEVHVLYMTAVFLFIAWVISAFSAHDLSAAKLFGGHFGLFIGAAVVWSIATVTHIWQDILEGDYMAAREERVIGLLRKAGYLNRAVDSRKSSVYLGWCAILLIYFVAGILAYDWYRGPHYHLSVSQWAIELLGCNGGW